MCLTKNQKCRVDTITVHKTDSETQSHYRAESMDRARFERVTNNDICKDKARPGTALLNRIRKGDWASPAVAVAVGWAVAI